MAWDDLDTELADMFALLERCFDRDRDAHYVVTGGTWAHIQRKPCKDCGAIRETPGTEYCDSCSKKRTKQTKARYRHRQQEKCLTQGQTWYSMGWRVDGRGNIRRRSTGQRQRVPIKDWRALERVCNENHT